MKGAREVKGDAGKQSAHKGGTPTGETEPLFPRLHVNETDKAGPRAPPRNKMALYEQFTIPSHRFVSSRGSSQPAVTPPYTQQYVPNDYRYSYLSYNMPQKLAYANVDAGAQTHVHPSFDNSSGSVVVDEDETQRVPGPQTVEKSGVVSNTVATSGANSNVKSVSEKKAKDNCDFHVPTLARVQYEVSGRSVCKISENSDKLCGSSTSDVVKPVPGVQTSSMLDSVHEASTTCKAGLDCSVSETHSCSSTGGKSAKISGRVLLNMTEKGSGKFYGQQNEVWSIRSPQRSCLQSVSSDAGCLPSCVHSTPEPGTSSRCTGAREFPRTAGDEPNSLEAISCDGRSRLPEISVLSTDDPESPLSPKGDLETSVLQTNNPGFDEGEKGFDPTLEENSGPNTGGNLHRSTRNTCEDSGESDTYSDGIGDVSEASQHGNGNAGGSDDSDLSMQDSVSAPPVAPKDVIRAVGQQQFWKARKAILRQQRIFSDQVFELHKLIEVQRLLADTSNLSIRGGLYGGPAPECDTDCSLGVNAEKENCADVEDQASTPKEVATGQSLGALAQPGLASCYPGWSQVMVNDPNSQVYSGSYPPLSSSNPSGFSVWGYPSLGVEQWMGPMAPQAGAFIYHPLAGNFPMGSPFGGAYGSAALGPVAPVGRPSMVSFGFPHGNQRPEVPPEMRVSYAPEGASTQQWHPAMCHSASIGHSTPYPSWYAIHNNAMHSNRLFAVRDCEEGPSGSVASISNQPEASVGTIKAAHGPGMQFHMGKSNLIVPRSVYQAEQSSRSVAIGSNANTLTSTPSIAFEKADCGHQHKLGLAQSSDLDGTKLSTGFDDDASLVRKMNAGSGAVSWSKRQRDGEVFIGSRGLDEEMDANLSEDQSVNALTLFPLVPSLSFNNDHSQKPGQTEKWQGQVIKVVPRPAVAASESAAGILLSIQQERQQ